MADIENRRQQYWEGQRKKASDADPENLRAALALLSLLPLSDENRAAGADWLKRNHKAGVIPENRPIIEDIATQAGLMASYAVPPLGIPANMAYEADRLENEREGGGDASVAPLLLAMTGMGGAKLASKFSMPERLAGRDVARAALGELPSTGRQIAGAGAGSVPGGVVGYQVADATIDPANAESDEAGNTRTMGTLLGMAVGAPVGVKGSRMLHDRKIGQMGDRLMGLSDVTVPEHNAYIGALDGRLQQAEAAAKSRKIIGGRIANLENQTIGPAGPGPGGPLPWRQPQPQTSPLRPSSAPPASGSTVGSSSAAGKYNGMQSWRDLEANLDRTVDEAMRVSTVRDAADVDPRAVTRELAGGNEVRAEFLDKSLGKWMDQNGPVLEAGGWRDPRTGKWTTGPRGAKGKLKPAKPDPTPGSLAPEAPPERKPRGSK